LPPQENPVTGRLKPPPFTELSYTFKANSASYLIPISFHTTKPSWTTARHNAFRYLWHSKGNTAFLSNASHNCYSITGSSKAAMPPSAPSHSPLVQHRIHAAPPPSAAATWNSNASSSFHQLIKSFIMPRNK